MKILNLGSCNIDYVYTLDHIVEVGETEMSQQLNIFPGGKGLNQSIAEEMQEQRYFMPDVSVMIAKYSQIY